MAVSLYINPLLFLGRLRPFIFLFRFPLGSSNQRNKTLADEALESFGVTIPLLQFNGVHSRCNTLDKGTAEDEDEDNDSDDKEDEETSTNPTGHATSALKRTNGLPVLKHHPYVITR
jgi:hypothetical protein